MKNHVLDRVVEVGLRFSQGDITTKELADTYGVSKTTIYDDLTKRLPKVDEQLAEDVRELMATKRAS
ncbi:sporulation transcriptional regulator SpoIIID [Paenibacillus pabuli]|uniref:sporulation transcriptional regulator SpoIIID n=1 Tax=Paenibacillus pabuli TaxID=1472 RepID=UPI003242D460